MERENEIPLLAFPNMELHVLTVKNFKQGLQLIYNIYPPKQDMDSRSLELQVKQFIDIKTLDTPLLKI